jgi:hypothetical protein
MMPIDNEQCNNGSRVANVEGRPTQRSQDTHRVLSGKGSLSRDLDEVHWTCGILHDFQAFREAWLRVFPAPK